MILHKMEQRSESWFDIKAGKISGTRFAALQMKTTTAGYNDLVAELAAEIITGKVDTNGYVSFDMQRGTDLESEAVNVYRDEINGYISHAGFIEPDPDHEFFGWIGISPDGLIGRPIEEPTDKGLIIDVEPVGVLEIKCPKIKTHFGYIRKNVMPSTYKYQVQAQLYVTGLEYVDFMSYYPNLKPFIIRVEKDPVIHKSFEENLRIIIPKVKEQIEFYKSYNFLV